jgi:sigma-B regulation protein RsbU (phosphoserine phosphatase)
VSALLAEIRFPAKPDRLRLARRVVAEAATLAGCTESCVDDVVLAVDEACQNIIRHAYGGPSENPILMQLRQDEGNLVIHLVDYAPAVDPAKIQPRPLEDVRPGGLGTYFIRELVDQHAFLAPPAGAGNLLQLVKRIS